MPGLTSLSVGDRRSVVDRKTAAMTPSHAERAAAFALAPTAAVWGELGGLRELSLTLPLAALPASFLGGLSGALRVLSLTITPPSVTGGHSAPKFELTDAALASLTMLEELTLSGLFSGGVGAPSFTGEGFASLSRLSSLALTHSLLPPRILAHVGMALRSLSLAHCTGLTDKTLSSVPAAVRAGIQTLNLRDAPPQVTASSFSGLSGLEELDVSCHLQPSLLSQAALVILGTLGRLRRLLAHADTFLEPRSAAAFDGSGLRELAHCPLVELDLIGPGNFYMRNAPDIGAIKTLRTLRLGCKELGGGAFLAALPLLEVCSSP